MRSLAWLLPLALGAGACGGATSEPPAQTCLEGSHRPAEDGCNDCTCSEGSWVCSATPCIEPACMDGATSGDGCNSCTCSGGAWACTDVYCPPPCEDGTIKAAGDGCNTCSCGDGEWLCTEKACAEPECPMLDGLPDQPCGPYAVYYGRTPGTDACCLLCGVDDEHIYYDSIEACEASKVCTPGETKYADDQCNTCMCTADGEWVCTASDCRAMTCGGITGGSCAEDEYCAYDSVTWDCRVPDLSALCRPRPTECTDEEAPVCGCDSETYSNACIAAMLGDWGVMSDGPCEAPPPD